jgi:hypothetical protein
MAALRFREWSADLSDGSKKRGPLPRASGILDAVSAVVAQCGQEAVVKVELVTNYGQAHVKERAEFLKLVDTHTTATVSMKQTIEFKKTRVFRRKSGAAITPADEGQATPQA